MKLYIDTVCKMHHINKKRLLNLYYTDKKTGRTDRFILEKGTLKVEANYLYPHKEELESLYFTMLECVHGNELAIARLVAKKLGKDEWSTYMYFRNFKFKNPSLAKKIIKIFRKYLQENHLFYSEQNNEKK